MWLTSDQQVNVARRACWYFDCYFGPPDNSVIFTGDGLEDLNSLIARLTSNALHNHNNKQQFLCDTGFQYSLWRRFDLEDLAAIRNQFIQFYGSVNKPNCYLARQGAAFPRA
jgi:hypothetical protein